MRRQPAGERGQGQRGKHLAQVGVDAQQQTRREADAGPGDAITSKERESAARLGQLEQELAAVRRDARLSAHDAYLSVRTGASRIGALQQSVRSDNTALEATVLGRDLGTRTQLDVLDAQQRLFATQRDLAQARTDYLLGRIGLSQAAGVLNETDLITLDRLLGR